jgi:hypothetical protein
MELAVSARELDDEALGPEHLGLWFPDPPSHTLPVDDLRVLRALREAERLDGVDRALGVTQDGYYDSYQETPPPVTAVAPEMVTAALGDFVAEDEPGAGALLGSDDAVLIPEGGDVMFYGDGGAGKSTLAIDLAFHLAAGDDWLEIPVPNPLSVLLIENEGPRPLLRKKLKRKHDAWAGSDLGDRLRVFEQPWGEFTLETGEWRNEISLIVAAYEIDVIIAGPLTRIGMNDAGTLQEVVAFMRQVADLRRLCGRPVTVILNHHENKAGAVSGAWEGSGDTLLHVEAAGNGHTIVFVQKARWDRERHGKTLRLAWADGEGFEVEGDRDYKAETIGLLRARGWLTLGEICAPKDDEPPGIGAGEKIVKAILEADQDVFETRTGDEAKALGRSPKAILWGLRSAPNGVDGVTLFSGSPEDSMGTTPTPFPLRTESSSEEVRDAGVELRSGPNGVTPISVSGTAVP